MNEYRKETNKVAKNSAWTFFRFLPLLLIILGVIFAINSLTKVGSTIVERKVFENSYQRSEGIKSGISMFEAQLAEVNSRLMHDPTNVDLLSQKSALTIQISTLESKR